MSASSGGLAYRQDSFPIIGPVLVTKKSKHCVSLLHLARTLLFRLSLFHSYPSHPFFVSFS